MCFSKIDSILIFSLFFFWKEREEGGCRFDFWFPFAFVFFPCGFKYSFKTTFLLLESVCLYFSYVLHSIYPFHARCCCLLHTQKPWNSYTTIITMCFYFVVYFRQWWISAPLQFMLFKMFILCCQDFKMTKRTWFVDFLVFTDINCWCIIEPYFETDSIPANSQ